MYAVLTEYLGTLLLLSMFMFVGNPIAVGAAVTLAIYIGRQTSSAHFNPAATLFAYLTGSLDASTGLMYVAAQLTAVATVWALQYVGI
jgi:glycerol uptake facilitator-like aquaporin